jgi:hypothetical protein
MTKSKGKASPDEQLYRRNEEAEKLKLIKFHKGRDAYELYNCAGIVPWHNQWHREMTNQQIVPVPFPLGGWHWYSDTKNGLRNGAR